MGWASQTTRVPFDEWRPDLPYTDVPAIERALNVVPGRFAYEPFSKLEDASSGSIDSECRGAVSATRQDETVAVIAGDATKLYLLSGAGGVFSDISRTAGYALGATSEESWQFAQFGERVIATSNTDNVQSIDISTATGTAADLAGSPPRARHVATVRDFVVLANTDTNRREVRWSGINDPEQWTPGTDQSGGQILPDNGVITGLVGGEVLYVFQETAINRFQYVGTPLIFQRDQISSNLGCIAGKTIVKVGAKVFFLAEDGFFMLENDQITPIGNEKVDNTFLADLNNAFRYKITAAADPLRKVVLWSYPSCASQGAGEPDKVICYNWATGTWSEAEYAVQAIFEIHSPGYTLDSLDSLSSSLDSLGFSLDSPTLRAGALCLAGFTTEGRMGFFMGKSLEATLETKEFAAPAGRISVKEAYPIVDAANCTVSIGTRERVSDSVVYTTPQAVDADNKADVRSNGRFVRARIVIPEDEEWTRAQAVEMTTSKQGRR